MTEIDNVPGKPGPVTSTITPGLAATISQGAPVAATEVIGALLTADGARRRFLARNVGANPVALVPAGGGYAAAVVLLPGEKYREVDAPGAAWYFICDTRPTSTINVRTAA